MDFSDSQGSTENMQYYFVLMRIIIGQDVPYAHIEKELLI